MRRFLLALAILPVFTGSLAAQSSAAVDFLQGLEEVQRSMDRRQWKTAYRGIQTLLRDHRGSEYVRIKRVEIEEAVKKCAFYKEASVPQLEDLVSADQLSWTESTGSLRARYRMKSRDALADFEGTGRNGWIHPAVFKGPYSIEIKGKSYSASGLLVAGFTQDLIYRAGFGGEQSNRIYRAFLDEKKSEEQKDLDETGKGPGESGAKFKIRLEVGHSVITAYYNDKRVLIGKKDRGVFGRVGFANFPSNSIDEILIKGTAQASWLQNVEDKALAEARESFEGSYKAAEHLPRWLLDESEEPGHLSIRDHVALAVPDPPMPGQDVYVRRAFEFFENDDFEAGLAYLKNLKPGLVTDSALDYLLAEFLYAMKRFEEAERHFLRAKAVDSEFIGNRLLNARFTALNGSEEEALKLYVGIMASYPQEAVVCTEYAQVLLLLGRQEEAKRVVDTGLARGIDPAGLRKINLLLVKALNGPKWSRFYQHSSKHYEVFSDIDVEACQEAARVLEEAYLGYTYHLKKPDSADKRKYRVYLFSGNAGYLSYIENLMGASPENSAGVYIPLLKQLLIWNLPDRESMMKTVRHEGFHQYLDGLVKYSPIWLNEGLAEYYEIAVRVKGRWSEGALHADHLSILKDGDVQLFYLEDFLRLEPAEFYKDGTTAYAQAWGFVHFLRHSSRRNQNLFTQLMNELYKGTSSSAAVEKVFGKLDLADLQDQFAKHLRELK